MSHTKHLPPGCFVFVRNLPPDATDESVSEWLSQYLHDAGPERITVTNFERWSSAILSCSNQMITELLTWAFQEVPRIPGGGKVQFTVPEFSRR
jgi:hypothetical protein